MTTTSLLMPEWLASRAALSPDAPALLAGPVGWSFAELDRRAGSSARRLAALGVAPGDRVALLLHNGPDFVELVHAVARRGAVLVPLNTRLTAPELIWQLADSGARLLLHDLQHAAPAAAAGAALPGLTPLAVAATTSRPLPAAPAAALPLPTRVDLAAVHSIVYTSGTTGRPKGALLTFGNHWWSAVGAALNLGHRHDDRWLAVLPLFHVGGLAILLRSVIYGIPAVVHQEFDPAAVNRAIDTEGVTIISVVSAMLQRLLDERGERAYPATLRCVLLGGGPAPRSLLDRCARLGVPVVQTYGLTEAASQVATLAPADARRKLGSAGKPLLPTEVRIEREDGPAPPGVPGEILVRGPTVTPGYLNQPDETARALQDGWLRTGDLGYLDGEGYLYVLDRRDDLIVSGGENVYPAEVEAVLLAHPAIAEAGVVGMADERWGQVPAAVIALRPGSTTGPADIVAFCAERLARYKVPKHIRLIDALPRTAAGKLRRHLLRALITAE